MKPIQVFVTETMHKALKQKALDENCTISDLIRKNLGSNIEVVKTQPIPIIKKVEKKPVSELLKINGVKVASEAECPRHHVPYRVCEQRH